MLIVNPYQDFDRDALDYIRRVEAADSAGLETGIKIAYNNFVRDCKKDGIWDAIKASCIMAGARTLSGALVPLVGSAPTNNNFVSGDYNRITGLKGDGSTKYLNSNRNNNADPQNNTHLSIFKNDSLSGTNPYWIGSASSSFSNANAVGQNGIYSNSDGYVGIAPPGGDLPPYYAAGLHAVSRSISSTITVKRPTAAAVNYSLASTTPPSANHFVFNVNVNGSPGTQWSLSRHSFYSIGESLDLALLDTRVSQLMTEISATLS